MPTKVSIRNICFAGNQNQSTRLPACRLSTHAICTVLTGTVHTSGFMVHMSKQLKFGFERLHPICFGSRSPIEPTRLLPPPCTYRVLPILLIVVAATHEQIMCEL